MLKDYWFWVRCSYVCATGSAVSLLLSLVAPGRWDWLADVMLMCVALSMIAMGAALFTGWRPTVTMPQMGASIGYNQRVRTYSSQQLRGRSP